ncbi:uncharacterized protein LOC144902694 [Branchiostoma floridae x Branchiostoma belcheri]
MASLAFSVYADKNGKNSMEDRHFMFKHRNGAFVAGVCDGHGGDFCSDFVARDLPENLSAEMDNHTDHETALRRAIRETDRELCSRLVGRWKKAGTTAVISLITGSEIITAWVGDSQAVLVRPNTEGIPLVTLHRCTSETERERIKKAGGTVTCHKGQFRLNGALSVSRSLGDTEYRPGLTAVPEVTHTQLTGTEEYLVLGSDGFFDQLSLESIRHSVYLSYMRHNGCLDNVANDLFIRAKNAGASDNITIITIFFTDQLSRPYKSENELGRLSRLSHFAQWEDEEDESSGSDSEDSEIDFLIQTSDEPLTDLLSPVGESSRLDVVSPPLFVPDAASNTSVETSTDFPDVTASSVSVERELSILKTISEEDFVVDKLPGPSITSEDEDTPSSSRPTSSSYEVPDLMCPKAEECATSPAESNKHQSTPASTPTPKAPIAVTRHQSSISLVSARSVEYVNPVDCLPAADFNRPTSGICAPTATPVVGSTVASSEPSPPPVPTNSPYRPPSSPVVRARPTVPRLSGPYLSVYTPHMYDKWQRVPKKVQSLPAHANQTPLPLKKVSIEMSRKLLKPATKKNAREYSPAAVRHGKKPDKVPATAKHKVASAPVLPVSVSVSSKQLAPRAERSSHQLQVHSFVMAQESDMPPVEGVNLVVSRKAALNKASTKASSNKPSRQASLKKPSSEAALKKPSSQAALKKPSSESALKKPSSQAALNKLSSQAALSSNKPSRQALLNKASTHAALKKPSSQAALSKPTSQAALSMQPSSQAALSKQPSSQASKRRDPSSSGSSPARPKKASSQVRGDEKPKKSKNAIRRALNSGKKRCQEVLEGGRKALKTTRQVLSLKVASVGFHLNRLGSAVSRKNRVGPLEPG